jgi:DNA-3-methyladenine glycosylase
MILQRSFYQKDTIEVAKNLLGKILVHETAEGTTSGRIVECEAYRGPEDLAAHSSGGRRTARNECMYGEKGHAYVYFIYGLYYCVNVTAGDVEGKPEAVLFRGLEPLEGVELMAKRRKTTVNLANGPSRLCIAMGITKAQNMADMTASPLYILDAPKVPEEEIVSTKRVGVDYGKEYKDMPWRFYLRGNKFVSVK